MKNENGKSIDEQAAIILQDCRKKGCIYAGEDGCEVNDPREVVLDLGEGGNGCYEVLVEDLDGNGHKSGILVQGKVLFGTEA